MLSLRSYFPIAILLAISGIYPLYAQQLSYTGSVQYAGGNYYFTERTYSFYFTNGLTFRRDGYSFSVSVPFIIQNSPWVSYTQSGFLPTGGPQNGYVGGKGGMNGQSGTGMSSSRGRRRIDIPDTTSYNRSSFSDPTLSMGIPLINSVTSNFATSLRLLGDLKIPLADPDQGYGTGAWDGGLGISLSQRVQSWFILLNMQYWWFGDMPDLKLNDALSYGGGIGKSFNKGKWLVLGSFNGMTRIISDTDPPLNVGGGISYSLSPKSMISGNVSFGLSDSSADFLVGAGWQFVLN